MIRMLVAVWVTWIEATSGPTEVIAQLCHPEALIESSDRFLDVQGHPEASACADMAAIRALSFKARYRGES